MFGSAGQQQPWASKWQNLLSFKWRNLLLTALGSAPTKTFPEGERAITS